MNHSEMNNSQQQPQQWSNFTPTPTSNSAPSYYPPYSTNLIPPSQQCYNYPQNYSRSCPSIDYSQNFEYSTPQNNGYHHYPTSNESSPSPTVINGNKTITTKYAPVRKLTRASSIPSNCSTPQPTTASNGVYCYPHQSASQSGQQQQLYPSLAFPGYDPILSLKNQDPTKPLYDGQKRGRKPKSDENDEEKKLAKRNYGRHYRKNKTLEALKVQEKFKTTKCYMDTIKNWANLNGCMDLAKLVEKHEKLMDEIDQFNGEYP